MKLRHTVFAFNTKGQPQLRTFTIGEVELNLLPSTFVVDGAVHDNFRLGTQSDAVLHLTAILKHLFLLGYKLDDIHYELIGIEGYEHALDNVRAEIDQHYRNL